MNGPSATRYASGEHALGHMVFQLLLPLEFILINLVVDMLYGFINPTIRYK